MEEPEEFGKMNCPVDGKGVRGLMKLREWGALWMGKVSGSQRNCENELTCGRERHQEINEFGRMNCPVDGKGVRKSTESRKNG